MVWRSAVGAYLVVTILLWAGSPSGAAGGSPIRPLPTCGAGGGGERLTPSGPGTAQQPGSDAAGPFVTSGLSVDGSAVVRASAGDLAVTKTIEPSGRSTFRLRRGSDVVQVVGDRTGVEIARNGRSLRLEPGTADEDEFLAVKTLLAGSRSVRAFRVLAAGIGPVVERTPGGMALTVSDALIGLLDGDVTAVHRLAQRLARVRTGVRLVRRDQGCYEAYEAEIMRAWSDYGDCAETFWYISAWRDACGLRWALWVESAWFAFIKCALSPFIS